jgi:hypothetical protein
MGHEEPHEIQTTRRPMMAGPTENPESCEDDTVLVRALAADIHQAIGRRGQVLSGQSSESDADVLQALWHAEIDGSEYVVQILPVDWDGWPEYAV